MKTEKVQGLQDDIAPAYDEALSSDGYPLGITGRGISGLSGAS